MAEYSRREGLARQHWREDLRRCLETRPLHVSSLPAFASFRVHTLVEKTAPGWGFTGATPEDCDLYELYHKRYNDKIVCATRKNVRVLVASRSHYFGYTPFVSHARFINGHRDVVVVYDEFPDVVFRHDINYGFSAEPRRTTDMGRFYLRYLHWHKSGRREIYPNVVDEVTA